MEWFHDRGRAYVLLVVLTLSGYRPAVGEGLQPNEDLRCYRKKEAYDTRNRWVYAQLVCSEEAVPDGARGAPRVLLSQEISLIQNLNGPEVRVDIRQLRPRLNSIQFVRSASGATHYSTRETWSAEEAERTRQLTKSLGLTFLALAGETNVVYQVVAPRNRVDVTIGTERVRLYLDSEGKTVSSCEFHAPDSSSFGEFSFSDGEWRQGVMIPSVWGYSDESRGVEGTFKVKSWRLLINMDETCFTREGTSKGLRAYMRDAEVQDIKERVAAVSLTDDQKRQIAEGLADIFKQTADLEQKYADSPDKLAEEARLLMDGWRKRLQKIKAGSAGASEAAVEAVSP